MTDWTRFDVNQSLRLLRSQNPSVVLKEVRKLHLRWWHAGREAMNTIFHSVGLPPSIEKTVAEVISTCRECRAWALPKPDVQSAVTMATAFLQYGEVDLMFYKDYIIFHIMDRCTRFHSGDEVKDKSEDTLINTYELVWCKIHGPPNAQARLKQLGTTVRVRAPGQHAQYIERRGRMFRLQLHKTEEQLKREGLRLSFRSIMSECFYMGNALTFIGGSSPYQAVYGRTPAMLPDLTLTQEDPTGAQQQRVRTIAINNMIQASAVARVGRSLNSKTHHGGRHSRERLGGCLEAAFQQGHERVEGTLQGNSTRTRTRTNHREHERPGQTE